MKIYEILNPSEFQKAFPIIHKWGTFITGIGFFSCLISLFLFPLIRVIFWGDPPFLPPHWFLVLGEGLKTFLFLFLFPFVFFILPSLPDDQKVEQNLRNDIDSIQEERKEIKAKIKDKKEDIFYTVQLNLNQLTEYYIISKEQAQSSFRISIYAMVFGTVILCVCIYFAITSASPNIPLSFLAGIGGVLTEFISCLYFYLFKKNQEQLNSFYQQLVRLQDIMVSIKLIEDISEKTKQNEIREKLILCLIPKSLSIMEQKNEKTA